MKELLVRTLSGLVYAGLIWLSLTSDDAWLWGLVLFSVFYFLEADELARLLALDKKSFLFLAALFWLASTAGIVYAAFTGSFGLIWNRYILIFIIAAWLLLAFWLVFYVVRGRSKAVWGLFYIALPYTVTLALLMVEPRLILFLFILIWVNDTFAYLTGKYTGRHKLWPKISPKKTWEGLIGGILAVLLLLYAALRWEPFNRLFYFLNGSQYRHLVPLLILVALLAVAGDLFESWLKRRAGVKDSGNIMPGHGGILDRLDSYLFAVTGFFLYLFFVFKFFE